MFLQRGAAMIPAISNASAMMATSALPLPRPWQEQQLQQWQWCP
jgi:hypothetical protein